MTEELPVIIDNRGDEGVGEALRWLPPVHQRREVIAGIWEPPRDGIDLTQNHTERDGTLAGRILQWLHWLGQGGVSPLAGRQQQTFG